MKSTIFCVALFSCLGLVAFTLPRPGNLPIGASLPKADVKLKDVSGKEVSLNDARKQNGLLVMFSCNTCPYVIRNQSRTNGICQYALSKGVGVILLNPNEGGRDRGDSYDEMKSYAKVQGYHWCYAVDKNNELADAFDANRTPECFLFDKSGKLVYHGAIDDNPGDGKSVKRQHLLEAINETLAGKDVSIKLSRSVGCGIKRL